MITNRQKSSGSANDFQLSASFTIDIACGKQAQKSLLLLFELPATLLRRRRTKEAMGQGENCIWFPILACPQVPSCAREEEGSPVDRQLSPARPTAPASVGVTFSSFPHNLKRSQNSASVSKQPVTTYWSDLVSS